jgi:hypothetical protein
MNNTPTEMMEQRDMYSEMFGDIEFSIKNLDGLLVVEIPSWFLSTDATDTQREAVRILQNAAEYLQQLLIDACEEH